MSNSVTHEWEFTIYFMNLDTDQFFNSGKYFDSEINMTQGEPITEPTYGEFSDTILDDNGGAVEIFDKGVPDFSEESTTNDGMYATDDIYGISYYFRGAVDNNWVLFANTYWRIIRINGDGTIRMIYSGTDKPTSEEAVVMTGENTQIGTSMFSSTTGSAEYAGYMYTLGEAHGLSTDSTIKTYIDTYYEESLSKYSSYIADTVYCNDRTAYTTTDYDTLITAVGTSQMYFSSSKNYAENNPVIICSETEDMYTVSDSVGNESLAYPISLLSREEALLAGIRHGLTTERSNNYLFTNQDIWFNAGSSVSSSGTLFISFLDIIGQYTGYTPGAVLGVRPVISLEGDISIKGTGTYDDPYIVIDANELSIEKISLSNDESNILTIDVYDHENGILGYKLISSSETCTKDNLVNNSIEVTSSELNKVCVYNNNDDSIEKILNLAKITYNYESPAMVNSSYIIIDLDSEYTLPIITDINNYDTIGWKNENGTIITDINQLTGDVVLTAVYQLQDLSDVLLMNDLYGYSTVESALSNINSKNVSYSSIAITDMGLIPNEDKNGTSYVYRGAVGNNWVKFADFYWRIVRINGDGTIRLVYSGSVEPTSEYAITNTSGNATIGKHYFNNDVSTVEYVGYKYTVGSQRGLTNSSNVKNVLENWYADNLIDYNHYIADSLFCYDRSSYLDTTKSSVATGTGTTVQYFSSWISTMIDKSPKLTCDNASDYYTVSSNQGNKSLTYPIGLLTADEVLISGIRNTSDTYGKNVYLYTGSQFSLGSPGAFTFGYVNNLNVSSYGTISYGTVNSEYDILPVINLNADITATGTGNYDDPYIIVID